MMLMLVTSDNFLQLFFGWEGVGLASYLLIGFWFKKPSANAAAIKAFVVNRVGDFGLAIGIFLLFKYLGTLNFSEVFQQISSLQNEKLSMLGMEGSLITFICVFLFIGCWLVSLSSPLSLGVSLLSLAIFSRCRCRWLVVLWFKVKKV